MGLFRTQQGLNKVLDGRAHSYTRIYVLHHVVGLNCTASRFLFLLSREFGFPRASSFDYKEILHIQMLIKNYFFIFLQQLM